MNMSNESELVNDLISRGIRINILNIGVSDSTVSNIIDK